MTPWECSSPNGHVSARIDSLCGKWAFPSLVPAAAWFIFLLLLSPAQAHVGSPNVYFEGKAGALPVRVTIRPPATLPGPAQVDVQTEGEIAGVNVRSIFFATGEATAPPTIAAERVAGANGLFHTSVWLLRKGAYSIQVEVESLAGTGHVAVPLNSAAYGNPTMPLGLAATLSVLGLALVIGALAITWAAAQPERVERIQGVTYPWRATLVVALLLLTAIVFGAYRWREMDRNFRENALDRPLPVAASVRTDGALRLLDLTPLSGAADPGWETLVADHGKLMHLFLLSDPEQATFAHLHPVRRDARTFENVLPPLPAGAYRLYAEITLASGLSRTLISQLTLPAPNGPELPPQADAATVNELWCRASSAPFGNAAQPYALDVDDSWHLGAPAAARQSGDYTQIAALPDGARMVFQNAGALVADRETSLRFAVIESAGRSVPLQPYIGMAGHAVLRRSDGAVFTHLHPAGTISMGAQELFSSAAPAPMTLPSEVRDVTFPYAFPREGNYRLWVQVRIGGRIRTGTFDVVVRPAGAKN